MPRRDPVTRSRHGRDFVDDYEWLREKESPEVRAHLEAENAYTAARLAHLKPLEDDLFAELKARVQETNMSLPVRSGDWWYFSRSFEGLNYQSLCRIPVADAADWQPPVIDPDTPGDAEETYLDCNALAEGHEFFSLGAASVTLDGNFLAYSVDTRGDERYTLRIRDLRTGEDLPEVIEGISSGATWVGSEELLYQRVDDAWRPHEVWCHTRGTEVSADRLLFREDDEKFWTGVGVTRSERFLVISSASIVTSEVWFADLSDPAWKDAEEPLTCVIPREEGVDYGLDHAVIEGEDLWLLIHNRNGVNSELAAHPAGVIRDWADVQTIVAHRDDARVAGLDIYKDHLVLSLREDALEENYLLRLDRPNPLAPGRLPETSDLLPGEQVIDTPWGEFRRLTLGTELGTTVPVGNTEWESPVLRVAYSAFATPARIFDIDLESGETTLRKEQVVLPDPQGRPFDAEKYTSSRLWVIARDGARIPVSLIHHVEVDPAAANPVLLYGYGSYETTIDPGFSLSRLSMLERGVVYAIAHVRGGGEMGRAWYETGKGLSKKNTFYDFIDVADYLLDNGMTTRDQLVAEGGSAGGLLMGAVANMAGDRFAGIEAIVPFVDPLTSMLMPELPLTVTEWDEWGDPYHDPEVYDYMATYAPYENISPAATYPPILAVTSLNDTRVLYVEPAKWVAKLREVAGADALMRIDMEAGHGGVSGRYDRWKQVSFETAWALHQMGATQRHL